MTHADSVPPAWADNVRDVPPSKATKWLRPRNAAVTSYSQKWDDQLPEDIARAADSTWRAADAKDLIALALWGIPVVIALTAAALL